MNKYHFRFSIPKYMRKWELDLKGYRRKTRGSVPEHFQDQICISVYGKDFYTAYGQAQKEYRAWLNIQKPPSPTPSSPT